MKKSSFIALVLGTVSIMAFSIGMCMTLLPEWNAFQPGVILSGIGLLLGLVTLVFWRKKEGKAPLRLSSRLVKCLAIAVGGTLQLGIGMCMVMVWNRQVMGILVGMGGILLLLFLIPMIKGFQE